MSVIATCHCGATRLELPRAPTHATSCTCTFCTKSGGLWAYFKPDEVTVLSETTAGVYSQTGYNQHHFCATCGCATYGVSPDWSLGDTEVPKGKKLAVNIRIIDDFDLSSVTIETIDGRNLW